MQSRNSVNFGLSFANRSSSMGSERKSGIIIFGRNLMKMITVSAQAASKAPSLNSLQSRLRSPVSRQQYQGFPR